MAPLGQNKHEEGICTETGPVSCQVGLLIHACNTHTPDKKEEGGNLFTTWAR